MSLSKFTADTNNIQSLPDQPSISASELKAKFDKTGAEIKEYMNNTLTEEIDLELANKANSNNTYNKTEVDEKIEGLRGTVLLQSKLIKPRNYDLATLNDNINNYKYIEVFSDTNMPFDNSVRCYNKFKSYVSFYISNFRVRQNHVIRLGTFRIAIEGNQLTLENSESWGVEISESNGVISMSDFTPIATITIIGYK